VLGAAAVVGTPSSTSAWMNTFLTPRKVPVEWPLRLRPRALAAAFLLLLRFKGGRRICRRGRGPGSCRSSSDIFCGRPLAEALAQSLLLGFLRWSSDLAVLFPMGAPELPGLGPRRAGVLRSSVWVAASSTWQRCRRCCSRPGLSRAAWILPRSCRRGDPGSGAGAWGHSFAPLALILILDPILLLPGPPR